MISDSISHRVTNPSPASERWVVVVARGNLDLLKQAIASFKRQAGDDGTDPADPPVNILCVNNDSPSDVAAWLTYSHVWSIHIKPQHGVAHAWNRALTYLFDVRGVERVLVCNSDVVLRHDTWHWLAAEQAEFVTAVGSHDPKSIDPLYVRTDEGGYTFSTWLVPRPDAKRPHPDFSCFMISRTCWQKVGPFDEGFRGAFCEDSDYHCRMHQAGIRAYSIDLPFWHVGGGSQTVKRASRSEQERILRHADANREYFRSKWGFDVPTPENGGKAYYAFFGHGQPDDDPDSQP